MTATHVITHHDRIPRFCRSPTVLAERSGAWSDPRTWSTGEVPRAGARVAIPAAVVVIYNVASDEEIDCIEVGSGAELRWATDAATRLRVAAIQVLPHGRLTIGTAASPVERGRIAEVIFADVALDVEGGDPAQYGNGLHVFGAISVHGDPMTRTFLRFAREAIAGSATLELEGPPMGWSAGDRLVIPDTRQIPFRGGQTFTSQAEEVTIRRVSGSTVTLNESLQFDHRGPRDGTGRVTALERSMLPHVGNLSRNVVLRSERLSESAKSGYCSGAENVVDAASCITRGHVLLLRRAVVDVRYARFENLGRTTIDPLDSATFKEDGSVRKVGRNQVGRYSIHAHHLIGPHNPTDTGYQFQLVGNVIEGTLKWGLAIHDSHYGLIRDNVLYDAQGAAVVTEDGCESFNVFERNFVVHTKAGDEEEILMRPQRGGVFDRRALFATTRDGFWFSGAHNFVRDNVVANAPDFAFNYNGYYLPRRQPVPDFRGADVSVDATLTAAPPLLESARNEAYGATGQGLWATWSRGCCDVSLYTEVSLFQDYRIWHVNFSGAEFFHESRNTLDRFVLRNDPAVSARNQGGRVRFGRGLDFANVSYETGQTTLRNLDIQGFNVGILLPMRPEDDTDEPNRTVVERSLLRNYVNIEEGFPRIDAKVTIIRDVVFAPLDIPAVRGQPEAPTAIHMRYHIDERTDLRSQRLSRTLVFGFNGISGSDFEVFFEEQAPKFPVPPASSSSEGAVGCPETGLTNEECMDRHGIAVAGAVAPCEEVDGDPDCNAARSRAAALGIRGLVFPFVGANGPRPSPRFVRGDCDDDGDPSSFNDAVFLLNFNFLGGVEPPCRAACDVDGDAFTGDVTDAIYMLTFHFLGGLPPVEPFPECGTGSPPAVPGLDCALEPFSCPW